MATRTGRFYLAVSWRNLLRHRRRTLITATAMGLGIAMCMYGREDESDALTTQLLHDKDPILRYSAMYTTAFAYACSGSNTALRRLLHVSVSDVSDDVRRAAVTASRAAGRVVIILALLQAR